MKTKLKKFLLFTLVSVSAIACKKNYTCNCTTTETVTTSTASYAYKYKNTSSSYSQKMTETQARSACQHEQDAIASTYTNYISGNGAAPGYLQRDNVSVECQLSN